MLLYYVVFITKIQKNNTNNQKKCEFFVIICIK